MNLKDLYMPISVVIAGAFIAVAIYYQGGAPAQPTIAELNKQNEVAEAAPTPEEKPLPDGPAERLTGNHVYGNPNASTVIVEFSDFECPFCSRVHPTLKQIVDESNGTIKWEYRHLPLSMHRNARPAAIASECVAKLTDNDGFWAYADMLAEKYSSITPALLKSEAEKLGVSAADYDACIVDTDIAAIVDEDARTAVSFGGSGTPFSVVVYEDGSKTPVNGALPYDMWTQYLPSN